MQPIITPRLLKPEEFDLYTSNWHELVHGGNSDALRDIFTRSNGVQNYVYLPKEFAALWEDKNTVAIRLKFVVAPDDAQSGTSAFSIALFGIDESDKPISDYYYLAGVAALRAEIEELPELSVAVEEAVIPFDEAVKWIIRWNALTVEELTLELFYSEQGPLLGYTYPVDDFQDAFSPATQPNAALWLNFVLHEPDPDGTTEGGAPLLFSTVLTLNTIPSGDSPGIIMLSRQDLYYDISKPCPPAC
ncbi:hypothetical protein [Hymenobacter terrenus]|uniref:hypothetical protein n=1 Tax=Hymenobacter terrenus TaxID=1629124 RepID=UPI0006194C13|nr:hypothetical protein [Hymenobacter terrenus]